MKNAWLAIPAILLLLSQASAVELLTSGNFETPGGVGEVPSWQLQEFVSGSGAPIDSAQVVGFGPFNGLKDLWMRPFIGGNTVGPNNLTNAVLSQTVPGVPGELYTFTGNSRWELNYSGGLANLTAGPLAGQPSPTRTNMHLEFLNSSGVVIGSPTSLDLRTQQNNFDNWVTHTLSNTAPAGTANVRVVAEARDMVSAVASGPQSAFYDTFSLERSGNPGVQILANSDLEDPVPSALDFWTLTEDPPTRADILRTAGFANHTPGGSLGVWLSAFFGQSSTFEPGPVDGTMTQTVAAMPNRNYTFSAWTRFEANYSGGVDTIAAGNPDGHGGELSPTQTKLELAFLNSSDQIIGTPVSIDVKASRRAQSPTQNANDNEWYQHTLTAMSPAGAVKARVLGAMIDGVFNVDPGQSAFFDDFSLDGPGPGGPTCDINGNGMCNNADINALYDAIFAGNNGAAFDFDGNGMVNNADIAGWLLAAGTTNGKVYKAGDANLDGTVGGADFTALASSFGASNANPANGAYWGNGNFDGNGTNSLFQVAGSDFTALASNFGFVSPAVAAVPEPAMNLAGVLCLFGWMCRVASRRKVA